ncbi:plasmolipin [Alligator mississippiensis]|uniref:Plasmolipin n=1 Tax=Alligator mississippiensis TaxID=8496 RepID=A0A151MR73_ALLMI|nr:plasmolipin [Alligator mississippiensis]
MARRQHVNLELVLLSGLGFAASEAALMPIKLPIKPICTNPANVFGLLVWALIADTYYQAYAAYGWVMFVSVFFWLVTVILFVMYLLQLHLKLYMIPWPIVLVIFNAAATLLYITAFITCSASVKQTSWLVWEYNRRAAASFFACVTMIAYGASTFLSYQAWKGVGSNAATSQVTNHA